MLVTDTGSQINSIILFNITTDLRSAMTVTNTVNFPLLAKHGLSGGRRHQSQVLLQKTVRIRIVVLLFCCSNDANIYVYLQTDCLCYFLHQAIIEGAVNSLLQGHSAG